MKRFHFFFTLLLLITGVNGRSQHSFELTISLENTETLCHSFEYGVNYYSVGVKQTDPGIVSYQPYIIKLSHAGELLNERTLFKQDTSFGFTFGLNKSNGNLFNVGALTDSLTRLDLNVTYLCEMTPDLDVVWEKMYPIPFPSHHSNHSIGNFLITPDSTIIIEGKIDTSEYGYNRFLYLSKFDLNGNLISFKFYLDWKDFSVGSGGSDLIFTPDSTGFYLVGELAYEIGYSRDWIEFDLELNMLNSGMMDDSLSYLRSPNSLKRISNGNVILANFSSDIIGLDYGDLEMRIIDQGFNLVKDTILYHDERVYIPDHRGMGFIDEDNIWVATFEANPTFFSGTSVFRFFNFDSNLHLKGMKVYGGDTRYWFFDLLATSDGGCLLTGAVPEYEEAHTEDAYLIKVMPEDIITHMEDTPSEHDRDVYVYPNPFTAELIAETMREGLRFVLSDSMGRPVLCETISNRPRHSFETVPLAPGFYFYQVFHRNNRIQSGKLIKN